MIAAFSCAKRSNHQRAHPSLEVARDVVAAARARLRRTARAGAACRHRVHGWRSRTWIASAATASRTAARHGRPAERWRRLAAAAARSAFICAAIASSRSRSSGVRSRIDRKSLAKPRRRTAYDHDAVLAVDSHVTRRSDRTSRSWRPHRPPVPRLTSIRTSAFFRYSPACGAASS